MTRTALYVSTNTTLQFVTNAPEDYAADIRRYPSGEAAGKAQGAVPLEVGIYLIHSKSFIAVTGTGFEAEVHIDDKDAWPDPPAGSLQPMVTDEQLKAFFRIAKAADGPDGSSQ